MTEMIGVARNTDEMEAFVIRGIAPEVDRAKLTGECEVRAYEACPGVK